MKTIKFIVKILVAAIVATCVALGVEALGVGYEYGFVTVFFATAIGVAALLGAFDMSAIKRDMKHTSIKDAARYGQAAIFVGTACVFMGSVDDCDELADDLWHYGQQAEVRQLTDETEFNIL